MANINKRKTLNLAQLRKKLEETRRQNMWPKKAKSCRCRRGGAEDADDDDVRILATSVLQNKRASTADTAPTATLATTVDGMDRTVSTFTVCDTFTSKDDPHQGKEELVRCFSGLVATNVQDGSITSVWVLHSLKAKVTLNVNIIPIN